MTGMEGKRGREVGKRAELVVGRFVLGFVKLYEKTDFNLSKVESHSTVLI